jgi:hypothetical protein
MWPGVADGKENSPCDLSGGGGGVGGSESYLHVQLQRVRALELEHKRAG